MTVIAQEHIAGLIVAGGSGTRMGSVDKCLLRVNGTTLLAHSIERLRPQVGVLALNANGAMDRFIPALNEIDMMLPILPDMPPSIGPLSGVIAGLTWLQNEPQEWLLTVAADTPFFPLDIGARLAQGLGLKSDLAVAASRSGMHPLFALWHKRLLPKLIQAQTDQHYRMQALVLDLCGIQVECDLVDAHTDAFFNINTLEDWERAQSVSDHSKIK